VEGGKIAGLWEPGTALI